MLHNRFWGQLKEGSRDGFPIGLGYLAVSFSLGIAARNAGLSPFQGFLGSFLTNASAGEYAAFTLIAAGAPYAELFIVTLVINARYFLMSCALSQRFNPKTPFIHRLLVGFDITDEIFSITISRPGDISPWYVYGAMLVSIPCWATGTALGIMTGNLLSVRVVSALSVALFGMFLAAIIPPARKNKVIGVLILASFAASFAAAYLPLISKLSGGSRTILLTIILSAAAAYICPVSQEREGNDEP